MKCEVDRLANNETVNEEYQFRGKESLEKYYKIDIYGDEKYLSGINENWVEMKIVCPGPFESCKKCQDSLDTLIPLLPKDELKIGQFKKWVISFTLPKTGSAILFDEKNPIVRGIKYNGTGKSWKTKDNMCTFPFSDQQSDRS